MRKINPRELALRDQIVDNADAVLSNGSKPRLIEVAHVQHYACGNYDTHVNHNLCYSHHVPLWVM